jgi:hypothetical protein
MPFVQAIAEDLVLDPFIVRVFELPRLAESSESQRHHDAFCLPARKISKTPVSFRPLDEQRSA